MMHGVTMILLMHDVTMILLMHGVTMKFNAPCFFIWRSLHVAVVETSEAPWFDTLHTCLRPYC